MPQEVEQKYKEMDNRRKKKVGIFVAQSRRSNIQLIGIPVKKNRENGGEEIIREIHTKNFPRTSGHE